LLAQTALGEFTEIRRRTLEDSLQYLACPRDKNVLLLDIENKDTISEGEFSCTACGTRYPIINGVPYFFESGNGFEWDAQATVSEIKQTLAETQDIQALWKMILSLGPFLLRQTKDRKASIDTLFEIVTFLAQDTITQAILMQAATAARYDLEKYTGTLILDASVIVNLQQQYRNGVIIEGACATGENLLVMASSIASPFYVGLDISGAMVRSAQQQAEERMLFVQGDICSLPFRKNAAGIYVLNNVFDRVVDPPKACTEAQKIVLAQNGYLVLSNCDPLQYTYKTVDGREILFVPPNKQLTLEQGLVLAGFEQQMEQRGTWQIQTIAYGAEQLQYKTIYGGRKK
jgi:uncharacterized protein YbaR (Trm112 family)/ubiquinone/menaquinone biosynthesis C-methylase UbiE